MNVFTLEVNSIKKKVTHIPVTLCPDARFFYHVCALVLSRFVQTNLESTHKRKYNISVII